MKEQRFLHGSQAAAEPTAPNPTGIVIRWKEATGVEIKIQLGHIPPATIRGNFHLQPGYPQRHRVPPTLEAKSQKSFASGSARRAA
ncbi:MAG TPA: hypothetical protein VIK53_02865 [Verrucomicrobiae bacterium]